jgi:hypothetical protein
VSFFESQSASERQAHHRDADRFFDGHLSAGRKPAGFGADGYQVVSGFPRASLFRRVLMESPLRAAFEGAPAGYLTVSKIHGYNISFKQLRDHAVCKHFGFSITAAAFYGLALLNIAKDADRGLQRR